MRRVIITLTLLVATVGVTYQRAEAQSRLQPETVSLRFASIPNYAFAIAGDTWGKHTRVTVTLHANGTVERLVMVTTARGTFLIGVSAADLCTTTSVQVRDDLHHRVALHGPQKPCVVILESSPRLTILRGKPVPACPNPPSHEIASKCG